MASVDKLTLKTRALGALGVLTVGQPPENDDLVRLEPFVRPTLSGLAAEEICYLADPENIPEEVHLYVAVILAWNASTEFGVIGDDLTALAAKRTDAESRLRAIFRGKPTYLPFRMEHI